MKKNFQQPFHISGFAVLLVLAVFALCLLIVVLTGAQVYTGLTEDGGIHHAQRTASAYLSTRLRQAEAVYTEAFEDVPSLVFPEEIDGTIYLTRVYCYDGWLRELFTEKEGHFSPIDGENLLEMDSLSVIIEGNCLQLCFSLPDGGTGSLLWQIRGTDHGE